MCAATRFLMIICLVYGGSSPALAQHGGGHAGGIPGGLGGGAVAGGGGFWGPSFIYLGYGPVGPFAVPPTAFVTPVYPGFAPGYLGGPQPAFNGAPFASSAPSLMPIARFTRVSRRIEADQASKPVPEEVQRAERTKSDDLVLRGDRFFRVKDYTRARNRYAKAGAADRNAVDPLIHEAQVDMVQGRYQDAAERVRQALTIDPDWIFNAPDIQAMYAEPADYAALIGKLETHLQAKPDDRDAWLVLGLEKYLNGKTRQAHDIFTRLTDRRGDTTLFTLLQAATPKDDGKAR